MNKKDFKKDSFGGILMFFWWMFNLPLVLPKWIFTKKSMDDIMEEIFDGKVGKKIYDNFFET